MATNFPTGLDTSFATHGDAKDAILAIENALGIQDPWHYVGAVGEPAFVNSWTAPETCRFRKDLAGNVHIVGYIRGGNDGTTVLTMPVGYRPPQIVRAVGGAGTSGTAFAAYDIAPTGVVSFYARGTGHTTSVSYGFCAVYSTFV